MLKTGIPLFWLHSNIAAQGGDLFNALQSSSHDSAEAHPLSWWRRGRSIALDVARGLHFLHSQHVVSVCCTSRQLILHMQVKQVTGTE